MIFSGSRKFIIFVEPYVPWGDGNMEETRLRYTVIGKLHCKRMESLYILTGYPVEIGATGFVLIFSVKVVERSGRWLER